MLYIAILTPALLCLCTGRWKLSILYLITSVGLYFLKEKLLLSRIKREDRWLQEILKGEDIEQVDVKPHLPRPKLVRENGAPMKVERPLEI